MGIKIASAIALLALLGAVFAFGGFGTGKTQADVPDSVRISFMKAVHEGDYSAAKAINEEYGIGGRMVENEELFGLRHQMQIKAESGDYAAALELQKQMGEIAKEQMPAKMGKGSRMGQGAGKAMGAGAGKGRANGGCQYAAEQSQKA